MIIRVGPPAYLLIENDREFIGTGYGYPDSSALCFDPGDRSAPQRYGLKVYVISYTNKTGDLEAIFEISYFQSIQKPKCHICYPYGPTKLPGKV